jgi:nitrous oxidase accessory protein NosD
VDGNKAQNEELNGNYAGCIFGQDCNRITVRNVTARNYRGDGISWQICHDVHVEDCHIHDNLNLGLHPGSGSQRPVIRNNKLERNQIGIFFCWGVKYGLAEKNTVRDAGHYGVSIGHHDTENLVCDNEIVGSGKAGVIFRPERGQGFAPHRNRLESNRIIDSGPADGVAVDVQGQTEAVTISGNDIRETRAPEKRVGIRLGRETHDIRLDDNKIEGFAEAIRR